jgi:hypothetical protein
MTEVELVVPYGKEGVLADIRKNVHVLSESYEEKGVCLKVKAPWHPYRLETTARFLRTPSVAPHFAGRARHFGVLKLVSSL